MSIGEQLRNPIWVRFADKAKEPVQQWLEANKARNSFDAAVLDYPATRVLAAHNNGTTYTYMPVQQTAMLESIGINPQATPTQVAASVLEMTKAAATLAHAAGFREIFFLVSDENTAQGAKLMGFEDCPFRVMRKRL